MGPFTCDVRCKELARRDLFELELLSNYIQASLFPSARRAQQKYSLAPVGLDLLEDEFEWFLGTADHDLSDKFFKQLVDLVLVEIGFNGLHEVHLLHLIHLLLNKLMS